MDDCRLGDQRLHNDAGGKALGYFDECRTGPDIPLAQSNHDLVGHRPRTSENGCRQPDLSIFQSKSASPDTALGHVLPMRHELRRHRHHGLVAMSIGDSTALRTCRRAFVERFVS